MARNLKTEMLAACLIFSFSLWTFILRLPAWQTLVRFASFVTFYHRRLQSVMLAELGSNDFRHTRDGEESGTGVSVSGESCRSWEAAQPSMGRTSPSEHHSIRPY
ncbi:hypothetical protein BaRGS_00035478 [Batillaria attramentaria]|uniref:Secreted protein n=1 Tax=Batillaria attramentaria TaxID=370345 RepID=A0ABD0JEN8_9CAEN